MIYFLSTKDGVNFNIAHMYRLGALLNVKSFIKLRSLPLSL